MMHEQLTVDREIIYAEPAGTPLGVDIFHPAVAEKAPIIMLLHGGGWCAGSRQGLDDFARQFAAAGYLAATVSYRLAPAFPFPAACEDVRAAAAWLVAHAAAYGGDTARLGAYGGSAGAHLVCWLATEPKTPLTCGVAWAGPSDLRREPVTYPFRSYALAFMGACIHDAPQAYLEASPLWRLTGRTPVAAASRHTGRRGTGRAYALDGTGCAASRRARRSDVSGWRRPYRRRPAEPCRRRAGKR